MPSSRRNSSSAIGRLLPVAVVVFIMLVIMRQMPRTPAPPRPGPFPVVTTPGMPPADAAAARNPISDMLAVRTGIVPVEGIGLAVLLDASGSMNDTVPGASGAQRPKMEIARQCLSDVVLAADAFCRKAAAAAAQPGGQPAPRVEMGLYEFSTRQSQDTCRVILPFQAPSVPAAQEALARVRADGGTPIGDAIIRAKQDLDRTGLTRRHILVITDGENNQGYAPQDVMNAISRLEEAQRASVYFIAFDVAAERFNAVRDAGALVLSASSEADLRQTLDYVLTGKVLVEQPTGVVP